MKQKNIIIVFMAILLGIFLLNRNKQPTSSICKDCNLIIIAYDALQAQHVSHLGYERETTPMLDKIAQNGVSFRNNISTASWTVPSYMSMFTGLFPTEHKVINKFVKFTEEEKILTNLKELSPEVQTIAEVFKENGYITGGFTGDAGINSVFGYNQGFDIYYDASVFGSVETAGEKALSWLQENKDKKFFMLLHGYDSHGQFNVGEEYQGRFVDTNYSGSYKGTPQEQMLLREEGLENGSISLTKEDVDFWNQWYDSKVRDADDRVAKIYDELEKMGALENTVIMVVSDHGTEFYEHNRFDHGHTIYEELVNVPLVISAPQLPKGKIIDNPISTINIAPTIVELLGLSTSDQFTNQNRGKSLLSLITKDEAIADDIFIETDYRNYTHKRGVRTIDGWKFIISMENGEKELYNLNIDPHEKNNVLDENSDIAYKLEMKVTKHLEDMGTDPYGEWRSDCLPVYAEQCK